MGLKKPTITPSQNHLQERQELVKIIKIQNFEYFNLASFLAKSVQVNLKNKPDITRLTLFDHSTNPIEPINRINLNEAYPPRLKCELKE